MKLTILSRLLLDLPLLSEPKRNLYLRSSFAKTWEGWGGVETQ